MIRLLPSLLFNIVMFGSGALLSLYGLALARFAPARLPELPRFWARLTLAALRLLCGVRVDVIGQPPSGGGVIIAAQHQSAMDIFVGLALLHRPAFVLKQELLRLPLFGGLLEPTGMVAVDRDGGAPALRKMVAACRLRLAEGRPIVIFPEGTRVAPGASGALQPGVVALAHALNVPVIPLGTDSGTRWGRKAFWKSPGPVNVRFFPALPPGLRREEMLAALAACFYGAPRQPLRPGSLNGSDLPDTAKVQ
jgi:1-acyl-sn-glycerol-3-phosphate acyltransferase